jgi:TolB-like protein
MLRLLSLVALLSALLLPGPAVAQDSGKLMLAVLEFSNDARLTAFEAETLADDVRGAALAVLGRSFRIMTRESMLEMLPPGTDLAQCSEGQCEVQAGRKVGADRVIAGSVGRVGTKMVVRLKLFDTHTADLLGQESGFRGTGFRGTVQRSS